MKPRGKPFEKGNRANPGGRPKENPIIKEFKETTYAQFIDGLQKYGSFTDAEMKAELKRPTATMFELMFCRIVAGAANGDKDSRQVLLDRLWGKVKEASQPVTLEGQAEVVVIKLPDNGRMPTDDPGKSP